VGEARRDGGRRDRGGPVPSDPAAGTPADGVPADADPTAAAPGSSPPPPVGDELRALPETYALALRLRAEGLADDAIARVLDIEAESVGPLLALAHAKLAGLEQRRRDDGDP
jgi:DNA-directed RNA polymerase specialized sigma24 family protein